MQNLLPHHVMSKGPVDHGHVSQIACQGTMVVERVSRCVEVQMRIAGGTWSSRQLLGERAGPTTATLAGPFDFLDTILCW
jgi:hypothetical protein